MLEYLRIDNVNDTVGDQDVGSDNAGAVDENAAIVDGDGQILAVGCLENSSVAETRAVAKSSSDDVVGQDISGLFGGQVSETGANSLESCVGRSEDGDVGSVVDCVSQVGRNDSSTKGSQSGGGESVSSFLG